MTKRITVEEKKNGWEVRLDGFIKAGGEYVYKATETIQLLEFIGEHIQNGKVRVEAK